MDSTSEKQDTLIHVISYYTLLWQHYINYIHYCHYCTMRLQTSSASIISQGYAPGYMPRAMPRAIRLGAYPMRPQTFLTETDCSKPAAHHCTWCAPAPNNWKIQNGPCVGPSSCASHRSWEDIIDIISIMDIIHFIWYNVI